LCNDHNLVTGEGSGLVSECDADGDGFAGFVCISVGDFDILYECAAVLLDGLADGCVDLGHEGEVDIHFGILGGLVVNKCDLIAVCECLNVDLGVNDGRLLVDLLGYGGIYDADLTDLGLAAVNCVEVSGMLIGMSCILLYELNGSVLDVVCEDCDDVAELAVDGLHALGLREEGDRELLLFVAESVLAESVNNATDLEYAEFGRIRGVILDLTELGGDD